MMDKRFMQRTQLIEKDEQLPKARIFGDADAKIGFISYGSTFGPILEAVERLESQGQKAKFMELRTLWPFPGQEAKQFIEGCDAVYVVEYSAGAQLKGLIQREATGPIPHKMHSILRYDGRLITPGT